jgi:type II secretory pathway pseudopilin PulG
MNRPLALLIFVAGAAHAADREPAARTLLTMRLAGAVLESYKESGETLPDSGTSAIDGAQLVHQLEAEFGRENGKYLTAKDGWGTPLRFLTAKDHYVLISFGADGRPDVGYGDESSIELPTRSARTPLDAPERDIIFADGVFVQRPQPKASSAKQAMTDLRSIGTAIESFAVDNNTYPGPTPDWVTLGAIATDLEPTYIRSLPRVDGWGHPYLFWSNGKKYAVVSVGADGILDQEYLEAGEATSPFGGNPVATPDPNGDIVFADGQFVRYPAGSDVP